jgi:hypothetical protein
MNSIPTLAHAAFANAPSRSGSDRGPIEHLRASLSTLGRVVAFLPRTALAMERVRPLVEEERRLEHRHPLRAARLRREIQEVFEAIA